MNGKAPNSLWAGFHSLPNKNPTPNCSMDGSEFCTIMKKIAATINKMLAAAINKTVRNILSPMAPVCAKSIVSTAFRRLSLN
jgi:hypothetical protein